MLTFVIIAAASIAVLMGLWELDDHIQVTGRIKDWYIDGRDRGEHAWRDACWKPTCLCEREHMLSPAVIIERLNRERATTAFQRAAARTYALTAQTGQ